MIRIRINDSRSLWLWCIKGADESPHRVDIWLICSLDVFAPADTLSFSSDILHIVTLFVNFTAFLQILFLGWAGRIWYYTFAEIRRKEKEGCSVGKEKEEKKDKESWKWRQTRTTRTNISRWYNCGRFSRYMSSHECGLGVSPMYTTCKRWHCYVHDYTIALQM